MTVKSANVRINKYSLSALYSGIKRNPILFGYGLLLVCQCLFNVFINIFKNDDLLGFDFSVMYTLAIEMWKQKTIFPEFMYQTTLLLDSPVPLVALFYGLSENIFRAYGIANIILTGVQVALFVKIVRLFSPNAKVSVVIGLTVLLSPFIANYYVPNAIGDLLNNLQVAAAYYSVRISIGLLYIYLFADALKNKSKRINAASVVLIAIAAVMSFITGMSSGLYLGVTYLVPLTLVSAAVMLHRKELNKRVVICVFSFGALILFGRIFAEHTFHWFTYDDKTLVGVNDFFTNLQGIYLGMLELMGGLTRFTGAKVFSPQGVVLLINFLFSHIFLFVIFVFTLRLFKTKNAFEQNENTSPILNLSVIVISILIFMLTLTSDGVGHYPIRYLTPLYVCMVVLFTIYLDPIKEIDAKKCRNFHVILLCLLIVSNIYSYYVYLTNTISNWNHSVQVALKKYDAKLVYGTEEPKVRSLRVLDTETVYKTFSVEDYGRGTVYHWGDYLYCDDVSEYDGNTLILASPEHYELLADYYKSKYVYQETLCEDPLFSVYLAKGNYFDHYNGLPKKGTVRNLVYTPGVRSQNGNIASDGYFHSDGSQGYILFGPYSQVVRERAAFDSYFNSYGSYSLNDEDIGVYDFTLIYEIINNASAQIAAGVFDVCTNNGTDIRGSIEIPTDATSVTLHDITFPDTSAAFEHRVYEYEGVEMIIESIEITKVEK
ncbi:MAG: hypothetical protein LBL96_11725 [Clostridiales bacterium]|jgi:hypothetical protein|nr:hypothetical protein [Clostridiales bacterium]